MPPKKVKEENKDEDLRLKELENKMNDLIGRQFVQEKDGSVSLSASLRLMTRLEKIETELKILRIDFENLKKDITPNSTNSGINRGGLV